MDYQCNFVTILDGKMQEAIEELTKIFGKGPGERIRGQVGWAIIEDEVSWHDPLDYKAKIGIWAFDWDFKDIRQHLQEKGIAA